MASLLGAKKKNAEAERRIDATVAAIAASGQFDLPERPVTPRDRVHAETLRLEWTADVLAALADHLGVDVEDLPDEPQAVPLGPEAHRSRAVAPQDAPEPAEGGNTPDAEDDPNTPSMEWTKQALVAYAEARNIENADSLTKQGILDALAEGESA